MTTRELKTINSVYKRLDELLAYNGVEHHIVLKKQRGNRARIHIVDNNNEMLTPQFEYMENLGNKRLDKGYDIFKYAYSNSHRESALNNCYQYLKDKGWKEESDVLRDKIIKNKEKDYEE